MGGGIRVEIPAHFSWLTAPAVIFMAAWTAIPTAWLYRTDLGSEETLFRFALIYAALGAVGFCVAAGWAVWTLTGRTVVSLDLSELKIQRSVAGIALDTGTFANSDVSSIRWIPPTLIWAFRTDTDPGTTKMQFAAKGKTIRFACGITEREACALIDGMLEVYKFPKEVAVDPVGVR